MRALLACSPLLVVVLLANREALAVPPSADLRDTFLPLHTEGGRAVEPVASPDTGDVTGHARLSYGYRPVVLEASEDLSYEIISHQITADVGLNVGLFERVTLGFDLPILAGQVGEDFSVDEEAVRILGRSAIPVTALGDPGIRAKVTIVKPEGGAKGVYKGFGLAVDGRLTLPLGNEASFMGEGEVTGLARLLAEYGAGVVSVHVGAGAKLRAEEAEFACPEPSSSCGSRFGHELPFYVGLALHPSELGVDSEGHWGLMLEGFGHMPLTPVTPDESTLPWALGGGATARYRTGDIAFIAGAYGSVLQSVGTPLVSGTLGVAFAPREGDSDDDGIVDRVDECATWAEDRDGHEDGDGCPEMDNDGDGVPDAMDDCPMLAGKTEDRGCAAGP